MRYGVWALAALVVGAFGAHFLLQDRGYVLISFVGYNIEMSVPVLALALVLLYAGVRLLLRLWRAPRQLGEAIAVQRTRRAGMRLARGLIHLTEGDFRRSERLLTDGLKGSDARVVNYLMAARAAEAQGSAERRDEWLALAREADPRAEVAVLLTQAELKLRAGEHRAALATLERVAERKPGHAGCLALMAEACLAQDDRDRLAGLLPRLAKSRLDPDRLAPLLANALEAMRGVAAFDRPRLNAVWSPLPLGLRRRPELIRARALLLDRFGRGEEALRSLAAALKHSFDRELVTAYAEIRGPDPQRQLRRAEAWLRQYPENAALLLAAARLCMANELWGKARSYLESSLALAPEPASYALYGELLDRLGEHDEAARAYQAGLKMVAPAVGALPALEAPWTADPREVQEADG
jgi:HemY protein